MTDSAPRREAESALVGDEEVAYPRRFSWPMRFLLAFFLAHIVGQSLIGLLPIYDFAEALEVRRRPYRLPTQEEQQKLLAEATDDNPSPRTERFMESADSVWDFHKPWPSADTRKALRKRARERREDEEASTPAWVGDWQDGGRYAAAWFGYRLRWQERLVGFDQHWPMFSPNASKWDWVVRARLVYEDDTETVIRSLADPEDVTRFRTPRFLSEKVLQYSLKLEKDETRRLGYCNLLAHRHPTNEAGSPLVKILLIKLGYDYPPPDKDVREEMEAQIGPPGWEKKPPFFEYDVATRVGRELK